MIALYQILAELIVIVSFGLAVVLIIIYDYLRTPLKTIGVYFIVGGGIELLSKVLASHSINNLFFLHYYTFFELLIISKLFYFLFIKHGVKINVNWILYISLFLMILNTAFIQGINIYNSYSSTLVSILIISYSLYYFYLNLDVAYENDQSNVLKWSIICFFIYHCTTLIVMCFSNLLLGFSQDIQLVIWGIRVVVILLTKILLFYFYTQLTFKIYQKKHV